jgi:hypothetical protein
MRPDRKADNALASSAENKNIFIYNPTSPLHLHDVHKNIFLFTFDQVLLEEILQSQVLVMKINITNLFEVTVKQQLTQDLHSKFKCISDKPELASERNYPLKCKFHIQNL